MKKHNKVKLMTLLAIFIVVAVNNRVGSFSAPVWLSALSSLTCIAVYCITAIALWRVVKMDELQKLIELRGIAIGFLSTLAILLIIGSFNDSGLIQLEITVDMMLAMMVLVWFVGQAIANWRYHLPKRNTESAVNGR